MEPEETTTPATCADCGHNHAAGSKCENCDCGADAAPAADAPAE